MKKQINYSRTFSRSQPNNIVRRRTNKFYDNFLGAFPSIEGKIAIRPLKKKLLKRSISRNKKRYRQHVNIRFPGCIVPRFQSRGSADSSFVSHSESPPVPTFPNLRGGPLCSALFSASLSPSPFLLLLPPFLSFPRNLDSPFPRSLLPYSKSSRPEVMRTASEEKRQRKGWWLVGGSREANRRALSALSVDGVFRGGDMESGNSCLAG